MTATYSNVIEKHTVEQLLS